MDTGYCLSRLRAEAEQAGASLPHYYMAVLRSAFCRRHRLREQEYGAWLHHVMPAVQREPSDLAFCWDSELLSAEAEALLAAGDACAEDRSDTGSIYTPEPVARFMAEESLLQVLASRYPELSQPAAMFLTGGALSREEAKGLLHAAGALRIIDLACGNGIFLRALKDCVQRLGDMAGERQAADRYVQGMLHGVDIRPDALETWALAAAWQSETPHGEATMNGACLSSVLGDTLLETAWMQRAMAQGGFDLVIGNPPYIGEKGNRALFEALREQPFGRRCYEGRMDLFYFFLHRGLDILCPGGVLCQLTTSYYTTADSAKGLRQRLRQEGSVSGLVAFNNQKVFADAGGHHLILFYQKGTETGSANALTYEKARPLKHYGFEDLNLRVGNGFIRHHQVPDRARFFDRHGHLVTDPSRWSSLWVGRLEGLNDCVLGDVVRISQGIVSGLDRHEGRGVFVLSGAEVTGPLQPYLVPWFKNSDIRRYRASEETDKRLLYIGNEDASTLNPAVTEYLAPYREQLNRRRECALGRRPWYGLQWPRERSLFEGAKLVVPQRSEENRFAYCEGPWYASADVYFLTHPAPGASLHALLAYLNSAPVYEWLKYCGKRKGTQLELYATPLGKIPVKRQWLEPEGTLDRLGKQLYAAADNPAACEALQEQVQEWVSIQFNEPIQ